jgi:hypothetical protein
MDFPVINILGVTLEPDDCGLYNLDVLHRVICKPFIEAGIAYPDNGLNPKWWLKIAQGTEAFSYLTNDFDDEAVSHFIFTDSQGCLHVVFELVFEYVMWAKPEFKRHLFELYQLSTDNEAVK